MTNEDMLDNKRSVNFKNWAVCGKVTKMVENNSHFTVWKVAEEVSRNAETVRLTFIRDINMNKVSAKMKLRNLRKAKV